MKNKYHERRTKVAASQNVYSWSLDDLQWMYDASQDAIVGGNLVIKRGHDWSQYSEFDISYIYNILYMMRDCEEGPSYQLARDLYSDLRQYRTSHDIR